MFEWFAGKSEPKEQYRPYVNPFKKGDRVELIWTFCFAGLHWPGSKTWLQNKY